MLFLKYSIIIFFFLFSSFVAFAQWSQIDYNGGQTYNIVKINQTLFAQTSGGIYKSVDSGDTWLNSNNDTILSLFSIPNFTSLGGSNTKMFAYNNVLYFKFENILIKSLDEGRTWKKYSFSSSLKFIDYLYLNDSLYAFTGSVDQKIYALDSNNWVFKSTSTNYQEFFQNSNLALYNYNNYGPQQGLYKSIDGVNFNKVSFVGVPKNDSIWTGNYMHYFYHINEFCVVGNNLFVVANDSLVLRSVNSSNWYKVSKGLPAGILHINSIVCNENMVIIRFSSTKVNDEFFSSNDYGETWQMSDFIEYTPKVRFKKKVIRTSNSGVYISNDNGINWVNTSIGIKTTYINFMKSFGDRIFAFDNNTNRLILSKDEGITWTSPTGLSKSGSYVSEQFVLSNHRAFIITTNGVFSSTDTGETWQEFTYPKYLNYINWIFLNEDGSAFIQTLDSLNNKQHFRTQDFVHYKYIDQTLPVIANYVSGFLFYKSELYAWAYVNSNIFKSADNGLTWTLDNVGLPTGTSFKINSLSIIDGKLVLSLFASNYLAMPRIYVKDGSSWVRKACAGLPKEVFAIDLVNNANEMYTYRGFTKKVFYSNDFADNWTMLDTFGLSNSVSITFSALAVTNNYVYIGTHNQGMWHHPTQKIKSGTNIYFSLDELSIYPNPAISSLNILHPTLKIVRYSIINSLGVEVTKGNYDYSKINIESLTNGIYILKIVFENEKESINKFIKY